MEMLESPSGFYRGLVPYLGDLSLVLPPVYMMGRIGKKGKPFVILVYFTIVREK